MLRFFGKVFGVLCANAKLDAGDVVPRAPSIAMTGRQSNGKLDVQARRPFDNAYVKAKSRGRIIDLLGKE